MVVQSEAIAGDIEANIIKVNNLLSETGKKEADLIILPELWSVGWDCPNFKKYAEDFENSKYIQYIKELALKYNANVIGGSSLIRNNNKKIRNRSIITNRNGEIIGSYDKYHLFSLRGESEGTYLEEGDTPVIVKTDIGRIGISTCYDIRFPEMFRLYAFNGTDLMVNMAAWPLNFYEEYKILSQARAIENQTFFINACITGKINEKYDFSGGSMIINHRGVIIDKLDREEKVLTSCVDLGTMEEYREQMPILKDTKKQYKILEK